MQLTISRVGDTITDSFDLGQGAVVLNAWSDFSLTAPTNISLFLLNAGEVGDSGASLGSFTHLVIATGADVVTRMPEPSSIALMLGFLVTFCFVTSCRKDRRAAGDHPTLS